MTGSVRNGDPLLDVPAVAKYLGLSETFVRQELRTGRLQGLRLGRLLRVRLSALEQYLAESGM